MAGGAMKGLRLLVTGAGDGLGAAIACEAARRGAQVIAVDIRTGAAEATAALCRLQGEKAMAVGADVSLESDMQRVAQEVGHAAGKLDILWANAGIGIPDGLVTASARDLEWLYAVNVQGVLNTVRCLLPLLVQNGRIAITGSIAGLTQVQPGRPAAYAASKYAVNGIAEALRCELAPRDIGVTLICPGSVATAKATGWRARPRRFGQALAPPQSSATTVVAARPLDAAGVAKAALDAVMANAPYLLLPESAERADLLARRNALLTAALRLPPVE